MPIRIATFNVENLFSRVAFPDSVQAGEDHVGLYQFKDEVELRLARRIAEAVASDDKRQLTALALFACRADLVCLQEVDDAHTLKVFYDRYVRPHLDAAAARDKRTQGVAARANGRPLDDAALRAIDRRHYFDWRVLIEGNDGRGIDVAILAKRPIKVTSHAHRTLAELGIWSDELAAYRETIDGRERRLQRGDRLFRRDCLEVDLEVDGAPLTVFVCHLKSMAPDRQKTRPLREAEARAVRKLVEARFAGSAATANWLICGDLNDYVEIDGEPVLDATGRPQPHGLGALLDPAFAENLVGRLAPTERWTTYHGPEDSYTQLDFILASPALARANQAVRPEIIREGQPYRAQRHAGARYPRVGWDRPKASDHCPVVVEISVPHPGPD
jgi:endonuclease/exonuclease/phosphatase family metal-dependent hydrolase